MVWNILIIVLSLSIIGTLFSFFYRDFWLTLGLQSLSIAEMTVLKASSHDANGFIKEYYDFKHKNISTCLKGTASVFVLCAGSLTKIAFENLEFSMKHPAHLLLAMIIFLLIIINVLLASELGKCNAEYAHSVIEYET